MLEVGGDNKEYKVIAGKKLGSGEMRNQILLLRCQFELGQKNILNNIDTKYLTKTKYLFYSQISMKCKSVGCLYCCIMGKIFISWKFVKDIKIFLNSE